MSKYGLRQLPKELAEFSKIYKLHAFSNNSKFYRTIRNVRRYYQRGRNARSFFVGPTCCGSGGVR